MHYATKFIGQKVEVVVDRPLGSNHPQWGFRYPVNYGFIPDTKAPDGEEVDAYILGIDSPVERYDGLCIAVIHRLDDDDDKLVICPEGMELSNAEIERMVDFQEKWFSIEIIRSTPQII